MERETWWKYSVSWNHINLESKDDFKMFNDSMYLETGIVTMKFKVLRFLIFFSVSQILHIKFSRKRIRSTLKIMSFHLKAPFFGSPRATPKYGNFGDSSIIHPVSPCSSSLFFFIRKQWNSFNSWPLSLSKPCSSRLLRTWWAGKMEKSMGTHFRKHPAITWTQVVKSPRLWKPQQVSNWRE